MALREGQRARLAGAVLVLIVLGAGALRLPALSGQPLDVDECYSLLAAQGFREHGRSVFLPTGYPYPRAVVHTATLAAALSLGGDPVLTGRLVSLLATLGSVLLTYAIARHWTGRFPALLAAALLAFLRWEGLHAASMRMYAFFQLAFLLWFWLGLRAVDRPRSWRRWLAVCLAGVAMGGIHRLALASLPAVLAGFAWALRGALRWPRAVGVLIATGASVLLGNQLQALAPAAEIAREDYGTWGVAVGIDWHNVGLTFLRHLQERAPLLPWLALLALPMAISRDDRKLAFGWIVALGAGATITAASGVQSPRYVLHLLPLFLGLAVAVLARGVADARAGHDTLGGLARPFAEALAALGRRASVPSAGAGVSALLGAGLVALGVGIDPLIGQPLELGHDQRALLGTGVILLLAGLLAPSWERAGTTVNALARIAVVVALAASAPGWLRALGSHRYPPFQQEALEILHAQMRPGDRLLATEHLVPFVRLPGVSIGFLSQRWRNGRFGSYATRKDLVTGLPFVDDAQTLRAWLAPNGRTFVLTDYRLDLHLDAALRETVEALPLLYRSDLSRLRNLPEHPEWEGQTHEYRIYLSGERSP